MPRPRTALRPFAVLVATVALIWSVLLPASDAGATPTRGISSTTVSDTTADGHEYVLRRLTIAPGGSTGWHYHEQDVYGLVVQGTLTHDDADCRVDGLYHAGQPIFERAGRGNVHIGRNLGSTNVVLYVFQVTRPHGPLSVDQPNPGCAFD